MVPCECLCCVTSGCSSTVVGLNSKNLNFPGVVVVVVVWWCGGGVVVVLWCGFFYP